MNQEIKYIRKRLIWLMEIEKELGCYIRQIENKLKKIERKSK